MDLLNDILQANRQQRYYITIDRLDEDWAEDRIRLRLIQALLRTAMDFSSVKNAKIIVGMRSDLLDRVFRLTRGAGFQEEKYQTSSLEILWDKAQLTQVLDTRIDVLIKSQYTKEKAGHTAVLPESITISKKVRQPSIDYMLDRTLSRPRAVIQFFNACISQSNGKATITTDAVLHAEGIYSRGRFRALVDEWFALYPNLPYYVQLLKDRPEVFRVKDISKDDINELCLHSATSEECTDGMDKDLMRRVAETNMAPETFRRQLVHIFYKVGLVGLKTDATLPVSWSFDGSPSVSEAEIGDETSITIHKTFWRHLGVHNRQDGVITRVD